MKEQIYRFIHRNRPLIGALLAFLYGMSLVAALCHKLPKPESLPLRSALATPNPALSLIADYAEEVQLFLPMIVLSLLVSDPLPGYAFLFVRGFFCGFSSAALFFWGSPFSFSAVYLLLHLSTLAAYTASVYCLSPLIRQKKDLSSAVPFLFYAGIIFLLCIIRNLVYYLFL